MKIWELPYLCLGIDGRDNHGVRTEEGQQQRRDFGASHEFGKLMSRLRLAGNALNP